MRITCIYTFTYFRNLEEDEGTSHQQNKYARTELGNRDDDNDVMDDEAPPPGTVRGEGVLGGREMSVSQLFSNEDRKIALQVVWSNGGCVVPQLKGTYHLMPLEVSTDDVTQIDVTIVTMIWLVSAYV